MVTGKVTLISSRGLKCGPREGLAWPLTDGAVVGELALSVRVSLEVAILRAVPFKLPFGRRFKLEAPDTDEGPGVVTVDGVTPPVLSVSLDTVEASGALATLPGQSQVPAAFRRSRKMKYRYFDVFWTRRLRT